MKVKLKQYLAELEQNQMFRQKGERVHIPTVTELAEAAGLTRQQMYRIAGNQLSKLDLTVADRIITHLRSLGFDMDVSDLLEYRPAGSED